MTAGIAEKGAGARGKLYGRNPSRAPPARKAVNATKYSPSRGGDQPNSSAPIAPRPAQSPFMLSMKLKALMTVTSHRMVMA